ncbi:hypothetical protein L218DRAFT_1005452 [Marasmius fiardii PR-910]|nr:hypothetical protein L218DRAFT_1005452 [Marasmius fiardii PR-910]
MSSTANFDFGTSAQSTGNSSTHGPFPIISLGGENSPDKSVFFSQSGIYPPPIPSFNGTIASSSYSSGGTWLANLKLLILSHRHADGTLCSNVLEHAVNANSEEDRSFIAAHTKLIQHILALEREKCAHLEASLQQVQEERDHFAKLYEEAKSRAKATTVSGSWHFAAQTCRTEPPVTSTDPGSSNNPPATPSPPSFSTLGSQAIPNITVSYILWEHLNFRPGYHMSETHTIWSDTGCLEPTPYITNCVRHRTEPAIMFFSGTQQGNRIPPVDRASLNGLISASAIDGNYKSLLRLRDCIGLAQIIYGITFEYRIATVFVPDNYYQLLAVDASPNWAYFTCFLDIEGTVLPTNNKTHWNNTPTVIPSLRTPHHGSTDAEYALFIFVHYDTCRHMGVILNNRGTVQLDTITAHRLFVGMLPENWKDTSDFRFSFEKKTISSSDSFKVPTQRFSMYPSTSPPIDMNRLNISDTHESEPVPMVQDSPSSNMGTTNMASSSNPTYTAIAGELAAGNELSARATQGSSSGGASVTQASTCHHDVSMNDGSSEGTLPEYDMMEH